MLVSRVLEVREEDPATAIRDFLERLMDSGAAERLFAPVVGEGGAVHGEVLTGKEGLRLVDPLWPVMAEGTARDLTEAMANEPESHFAALLRPCEQRTVIEMAKRGAFPLERLTVIGVDCLSTVDPAYREEADREHPQDRRWLEERALRFAQTGQVAPGARLACDLCERPAPDYQASQVILGLIGVQTDEKVLVLADEADDDSLRLQRLTERPATERETVDREVTVWRLSERRKEAAEHRLEALGLADGYPGVISGYLARCDLCGKCLEACQLCSGPLREALQQGHDAFVSALINESLRLASCSGCGMCQASCPQGIPLCAISRSLGRQVQGRMRYVPGRDVREPLPWAS
jgi:ferredoxin